MFSARPRRAQSLDCFSITFITSYRNRYTLAIVASEYSKQLTYCQFIIIGIVFDVTVRK